MAGFKIGPSSVWDIWRLRHQPRALIASPLPNKRRAKRTPSEVASAIQAVPLCQRQTLGALANAVDIPKSTLRRYVKSGVLRRFVSHVKPTLTAPHQQKRLAFALSHVQKSIDEKWFNLYKAPARYYLAGNEALPYRSTSNKRYIDKVVFLAAVARPRYDHHKKTYFDGKTGIWPIVEAVPAKRPSANCPAGTPVIQNINMTREVYVRMLKEKVFPTIRKLWPGDRSTVIKVQQDNAGPHVLETNAEILAAGREEKWSIVMECQPPQSPDLSVLDLGLFSSLQFVQRQSESHTTGALIDAINGAFKRIQAETINKAFLTLQKVMESVIENEGSNNFQLPRVRKLHFHRGVPPSTLPISYDVVQNGFASLERMAN